jgi:hypothetical protein
MHDSPSPSNGTSASAAPPAERYCDVVMKGGITSGVVYPLALVELAKHYRFKNIGGTSAGAIAAAATAAAELGRGKKDAGFERLEKLPRELGAGKPHNQLLGFFQPHPCARGVFAILLAALGGGWRAIPRVIRAALKAVPEWAFVGALPGLLMGWLALAQLDGVGASAGVIVALVVTLIGMLLMMLVGVVLALRACLSAHDFGLCSGMNPNPFPAAQAPLTEWLTDYLDALAARDNPTGPLTFGDLWGWPPPKAAADAAAEADEDDEAVPPPAPRRINLEMMTTCLTMGRPFRLPFRSDERVRENARFYFRRDEFAALFPERVVAWMIEHPRPLTLRAKKPEERAQERIERQAERDALAQEGLHPLPAPENLPVVVATRMSLSFPLLLAAIPLHARDHEDEAPGKKAAPLQRCWFSDGGICSNFPVHFFDSALPRWPTFAINLASRKQPEDAAVWMPTDNRGGIQENWNEFDRRGGLRAIGGFLMAILSTAKDWPDTTQSRLPGFRDRIAHVRLNQEEGGLNLNMPDKRIEKLAGFGKVAGEMFVERFVGPCPPDIKLTWANHRRIRLRTSLAAIEEMILNLESAVARPVGDDVAYDAAGGPMHDKASYGWSNNAQRDTAIAVLSDLRAIAGKLGKATTRQMLDAPRPYPELRTRPRI